MSWYKFGITSDRVLIICLAFWCRTLVWKSLLVLPSKDNLLVCLYAFNILDKKAGWLFILCYCSTKYWWCWRKFFRFQDIDGGFKQNLQMLIPSLLSSENLVVKKINGMPVTCRGLVEYFKARIFSLAMLWWPKFITISLVHFWIFFKWK